MNADATPARYTARPLPAYRHVPGRTPHPTLHPDGHSYGESMAPQPDLNTAPWQACPAWLYGVDLFNAGYWWECHEVLEGLWHVARPGTPAGHALQAVIQCAAAHLKFLCGQVNGAKRLVEHAVPHAERAASRPLGLDLPDLVSATRAHVLAGAPPARLTLVSRDGDIPHDL